MKPLKILAFLLFAYGSGLAQNATKDASGNFHQVATRKQVAPANTGKTYTTTKGEVLPVFSGAKGALFVVRKSKKTGAEYRQYLKTN